MHKAPRKVGVAQKSSARRCGQVGGVRNRAVSDRAEKSCPKTIFTLFRTWAIFRTLY